MYHRFEENKYPSTNIKIEDFKKHLKLITDSGFKFISHEEFSNAIKENNLEKKLLLTIDDGFTSFYKEAWPILKKNKIPFILFVNTETVGANGYMDWKQIKEIANSKNGYVGNHSHSHDYLVDMSDKEIRRDLETSIEIFEQNLKYKSEFFAYPFGEYKKSYIEIVKSLGFEFAFGQHSGVMDKTKNHYELPRFPINEKYGEIKRFNSLLKTIPFPYKKIFPEEKYLTKEKNPPNVKILFFDEKLNLKNINCYSNEGDK